MNNISNQILTVLTAFPGNLVYHLILASSVAGALQAAVYRWRDSDLPQGRRMVVGLGVLLGIRLLLFAAAGLTMQGFIDPHTILPILDRMATIFGLLFIIWLWVFPEPKSLSDIGGILIGLLTMMIAILSWVWWQGQSANYYFNTVWLDLGWSVYALILIVIGIMLISIHQPDGWGYGLSMFVIAAIGHIIHLIFPVPENDFPGVVRLAQIAAYPLLLALPRRFSTLERSLQLTSVRPTIRSRLKYGIEPKRLDPLLTMMSETAQPKLFKVITRSVAEIMLADIVFLFSTPNSSGQYIVHCGYDLISQEYLEGMSIDQDKLPLLTSAMQQSRSLRLPASSTSQDLFSLGNILALGHTGHFLAAFIPSSENSPLWGVVTLSPHSNRRWSREDQKYLEKIAGSLTAILQRNKRLEVVRNELEETQQNLHSFQALFDETQVENNVLKANLDKTNQALPEDQSINDRLETAQHKTQDTIADLKAENDHLSEMVEALLADNDDTTSASQNDQMQHELDLALEEIYRLNQQLAGLEKQEGIEFGTLSESSGVLSDNQIDIFTLITQDLRQQMSSIVGYTNLLLDESTGILGAVEKKFLERVSSSTERMKMLLEDLVQVAFLDGEHFPFQPESVALGYAIDKAVADTSEQMREKKITLRVDLPQNMPSIRADRDALQQILIHLLKNASAVSPIEGEISLHAGVHDSETEQHFVLIQVADQGGGIPKDDLPRVFSRVYRSENSLIAGIGDTGVGLSIVRALVEAQNGRIWVDTEEGVGSTFSLFLPFSNSNTSKGGA